MTKMKSKFLKFKNVEICDFFGVRKDESVCYFTIKIVDTMLSMLFGIIAAILILYSIYCIWDTNSVVDESSPLKSESYKPTAGSTESFNQLKHLNSDLVGWLSIYGTNIDYPLFHTDDNEKYLNHDYKCDYSLGGSIFLDYRNHSDFKDFNTIIYGHNMAYGVMFGDLIKFKDEEFFNTHRNGELFDGQKNRGIEIIAFLETDAYYSAVYSPNIQDESDKKSYIDAIKSEAMFFNSTVNIRTEDSLVFLSTCTTQITNGRFILVGKLCDKTFDNPFSTEGASSSRFKLDSLNESLPLILIFILLVLGVIFIVSLMAYVRHKLKLDK